MSMDMEKAFEKYNTHLQQNFQQTRNRRKHPQPNEEPKANIIVNKYYLPKIWNKARMLFLPLVVNMGGSSQFNKERKKK